MNEAFTFTIVKHIATLSMKSTGYTKQLNLISWNNREPKLDIRDWSPTNHGIKGITITDAEARILLQALQEYFSEIDQAAPTQSTKSQSDDNSHTTQFEGEQQCLKLY